MGKKRKQKAKAKTKAKSKPTLDQMFSTLVRQGETMGAARKRRESRTARNLLTMKKVWDAKHEKIIEGLLKKDHIRAIVVTERCGACKEENQHVRDLELWSKASTVNGDVWRLTGTITGTVVYDLYKHLPIKVINISKFPARCARCLIDDAEERKCEREDLSLAG